MSKFQRWFQMNVQGRSGKVHTFETPLAMLYWGIQVGRRMERESAQALSEMEEGAK